MNEREFLEQAVISNNFIELINDQNIYDHILSVDEHVKLMEGFDQKNPHHVYDVLWHTFHTVDNVKKEDIDDEQYKLLRISAFFHDIGKPECMSETIKNGKVRRHFYGHPQKSVEITKPILEKFEYGEYEKNKILFMVECHDIFMDFKEENDPKLKSSKLAITPKSLKNRIDKINIIEKYNVTIEDFIVLTNLMRADAMAQAPIVIDEFGELIDTMEAKVKRVTLIKECLNKISLY